MVSVAGSSSMSDGTTTLATVIPSGLTGNLIGNLVQVKIIPVDTSLAPLG